MRFKLLVIIPLLFLIPVPSVFAAWTNTYEGVESVVWQNGQTLNRIKIKCISDGADPSSFLLSSLSVPAVFYQGGIFYQIDTDPGTAPDAAYTLAITSDKGASILSLSDLSVSATEITNGGNDLGTKPIVFDLGIDFGDIGTAADYVELYIYIIK